MNKRDLKRAAYLSNVKYLLRSEDIQFKETIKPGGFIELKSKELTLLFDNKGKLVIIDD